MALNVNTLANNLFDVFDAMRSMTEDNDSYFAERVAKVFTDWYNGGTAVTTEAGAFSGNVIISAAGEGNPQAPAASLESVISTACSAMNGQNSVLAMAMGTGMIASVALPVQIAVDGMMAVPAPPASPVPTPFSGQSIGTVAPVLAALPATLLNIFESMNDLPEGTDGNRYLADELAGALSSLAGATVASVGVPPLTGGGTGSIT